MLAVANVTDGEIEELVEALVDWQDDQSQERRVQG